MCKSLGIRPLTASPPCHSLNSRKSLGQMMNRSATVADSHVLRDIRRQNASLGDTQQESSRASYSGPEFVSGKVTITEV
jgi:hypothetical protein